MASSGAINQRDMEVELLCMYIIASKLGDALTWRMLICSLYGRI